MEANEASCEISSSISGKRSKRSTSIVWNTFTKLPRTRDSEKLKAQCQVSKEIFVADAGTSNMKRHIAKHLDNIQEHGYAPIDQITYREKVSVASNGYMCLTAHYIDLNWNLQKRVLIFRHVPPPHSGSVLGPLLIEFIKEWGIEKKIFTLTLDNASCNNGVVDHLKEHLSLMCSLVCDGKFFHVRCGNHILNLIVKAGLAKADGAIEKVREGVKHIKHSEGRILKKCYGRVSFFAQLHLASSLQPLAVKTMLQIAIEEDDILASCCTAGCCTAGD